MPLAKNNGQDLASMPLISTNRAGEKQEDSVQGNNSYTKSPPWSALGAKPNNKSSHKEKGGQEIDRAQFAEISDATGWPALPFRLNTSSTPLLTKAQLRPVVRRKATSKPPPHQPDMQLQIRFALLLQDSGSPSDDLDEISLHTRVRPNSNSESKRQQRKLNAGPQTLTVGDFGVKDLRYMCGQRTKVLCFPKDTVSDVRDKVAQTVADHPTVENLILHVGSNDVAKKQSEVLKEDFTELLDTISCLGIRILISGSLPPIRGGVERFSRLFSLNTWMSAVWTTHSHTQFIS